MEITLLVSPHGSITFHCDHPFTHKLIQLSELEKEIQALIDQQVEEESCVENEEAWELELEKHLQEQDAERALKY